MSNPVLPEEIITHIISFLSVKEILPMKSVCKSWNTFLSHSSFIKMHLKKTTSRKTLFLPPKLIHLSDSTVLPFPISPFPRKFSGDIVIGSCNGLLCFLDDTINFEHNNNIELRFRFWNPATQKKSKKFGTFFPDLSACSLKCAFGYDNLTDSYKIVAIDLYGHYSKNKNASSRNTAKVFGSRDKVWRSLQSFPGIPLGYNDDNTGVYLNGTLNWLAVHNNSGSIDWNTITVKQVVIVSLDLGTETYTQLLPPKGFDAVPHVEPTICTMMDCLCFVHDVKKTHFVIWKMLEFGVEKSWTQYFKIKYQNIQIQNGNINMSNHFQLLPLCLSKNGDALILANFRESEAILYYWNDNRTERISIPIRKSKWVHWHAYVKDYVESLAPTG